MMDELRGWRKMPLGSVAFRLSTEKKTGDWRTERPVIDHSKCVMCFLCWIYCPEMAIELLNDERLIVNYDFCKGCGICATECPVNAIRMELEVI